MNITIEIAAAEDCKPSYVESCSPPPEPLEDCPNGWEFSNTGSPVCADAPPLALTGGEDLSGAAIMGLSLVLVGAVSIAIAAKLTQRKRQGR